MMQQDTLSNMSRQQASADDQIWVLRHNMNGARFHVLLLLALAVPICICTAAFILHPAWLPMLQAQEMGALLQAAIVGVLLIGSVVKAAHLWWHWAPGRAMRHRLLHITEQAVLAGNYRQGGTPFWLPYETLEVVLISKSAGADRIQLSARQGGNLIISSDEFTSRTEYRRCADLLLRILLERARQQAAAKPPAAPSAAHAAKFSAAGSAAPSTEL